MKKMISSTYEIDGKVVYAPNLRSAVASVIAESPRCGQYIFHVRFLGGSGWYDARTGITVSAETMVEGRGN